MIARGPRFRRLRQCAHASLLCAAAGVGGCTCGSKQSTPVDASPATATATSSAAPAHGREAARLSAPIAAARLPGGAVVAAGLDVPSKSVVATRLEPDGRTSWTKDILGGVAWSSDAELRVHAAGDGAAIVWRGTRDGKRVKKLVFVGPDGVVRGDPLDIGAASCATSEHVAWIERGDTGASRVRGRKHQGGVVEDLLSVHKDREALLVCTEKRVFALGEGEDDAELVGSGTEGPWKVLRDQDYTGDDELREHLEYVAGDDVGVLRLTQGGALHFRELRQGALSPWKKVSVGIPREDDVVAVEATSGFVAAVYTRDELEACDGDAHAVSVHVARFDRKTGEGTHSILSPVGCGKDVGPFWAGRSGERVIVTWAERPSALAKGAPSIEGVAYRVVEAEKVGDAKRIPRSADALVEAGCDSTACLLVALARASGEPDTKPTALALVRVP